MSGFLWSRRLVLFCIHLRRNRVDADLSISRRYKRSNVFGCGWLLKFVLGKRCARGTYWWAVDYGA